MVTNSTIFYTTRLNINPKTDLETKEIFFLEGMSGLPTVCRDISKNHQPIGASGYSNYAGIFLIFLGYRSSELIKLINSLIQI